MWRRNEHRGLVQSIAKSVAMPVLATDTVLALVVDAEDVIVVRRGAVSHQLHRALGYWELPSRSTPTVSSRQVPVRVHLKGRLEHLVGEILRDSPPPIAPNQHVPAGEEASRSPPCPSGAVCRDGYPPQVPVAPPDHYGELGFGAGNFVEDVCHGPLSPSKHSPGA